MKKITILATLVMAISVASAVLAHGGRATFDGIVRSAGGLQFELMKKNKTAIISIQKQDKKFSTVGATGTLIVINGSTKTEVPLQPNGENLMETTGDVNLGFGTRAIAAITFADNKTVSVNFLVK